MKKNQTKLDSLWISISNIDMPQVHWIWWVIKGTLKSPAEGSRSFNSFHALKEDVEGRGYRPPTLAQINEAVLQARVDGKNEANFQVVPPQTRKNDA